MSLVPPRRLRPPLLGMAIVCALSMALHADDVQEVGKPCETGGDGAQHADDPSINGPPASGPCPCREPAVPPREAVAIVSDVPPGTLGQTYQLPSRPVPAKKHPRVAMLDVCTNACADVCTACAPLVIVRWTNDFRTEESLHGHRDEANPSLWHFESKPLLPGLSHIYRVEVYQGGPGSIPADVRYVRLIMGRLVYLTL